MLISICYITLPVFILIQSVNSVDLYKSKRVPRDLGKIKTPFNSNHPPLQEQHIPVSVIYDDEDDIRILTKSTKKVTQSTAESRVTLPSSIRNNVPIVLTLKSQFSNGPYDTIPVAIVTDDTKDKTSDRKNKEIPVAVVTDDTKGKNSDIKNEKKPVAIVTDDTKDKTSDRKNQEIPVAVVTDDTKGKNSDSKNEKKPVAIVTDDTKDKNSDSKNEEIPVAIIIDDTKEKNSDSKNEEIPVATVTYDTKGKNSNRINEKILVAIVTDDTKEKNNDNINKEKSVSNVAEQVKINEFDTSINIQESKVIKQQGRSIKIEATTSSSDVSAPVSNLRKSPQRRRLQRVIKTKVNKSQNSWNEKPAITPGAVVKDQTKANPQNNSQPTRSSQFQKRTIITDDTREKNSNGINEKIPVAIVTDDTKEKNSDSISKEKSVSVVAEQEKIIEFDKSTNNKEPKVIKQQGQSIKIEATTSSSDINASVSNLRKSPQRRRLQRVIKTKDNKNQNSWNEKPDKTPATVVKDQTKVNPKNNSQPTRSSQFQKRTMISDDRKEKNSNRRNEKIPVAIVTYDTKEKNSDSINEEKTKVNPKNNSQTTRSSQFQKRTKQPDPIVPIVDSENYVYAFNGDYHYSYEGGDGTRAYERGEQVKAASGSSSGNGVVGGFSYTDNDGNDFSLSYTADENGYRPIGAHLPTPPPIPPAIQRALDILATKTTPEPITERVNRLN